MNKGLFFGLLGFFLNLSTGYAQGDSPFNLIVVEQKGCHYCMAWKEEVGINYPKTQEGKLAPLRLVDLHQEIPEDLDIKPVIFTPTFILVYKGREVGRLEGYTLEDFFWPYLNQMIAANSVILDDR